MTLKPIRFDNVAGVNRYRCSESSDHSGKYFKAEDVRERMTGLVDACKSLLEMPMLTDRTYDQVQAVRKKAREALAALPSPPQANHPQEPT